MRTGIAYPFIISRDLNIETINLGFSGNGLLEKELGAKGINKVFKKNLCWFEKEGMKNIYYLPSENLIGSDGEATVDGVHLTDLGFMRIAKKIEEQLKKILHLR